MIYLSGLPGNCLNCRYVIREAYNNANAMQRLLSVVVIGSLIKINTPYYLFYIPGSMAREGHKGRPGQLIVSNNF